MARTKPGWYARTKRTAFEQEAEDKRRNRHAQSMIWLRAMTIAMSNKKPVAYAVLVADNALKRVIAKHEKIMLGDPMLENTMPGLVGRRRKL